MALEKLTITGYSDPAYSTEADTCTVQINPSSYTHNHEVSYTDGVAIGAPGGVLGFQGIKPQNVAFEIYFDATGTVDGSITAVDDQITTFKEICFDYQAELHEPNYLIISWGTLVFKCKLKSLDLTYSLFKQDGTPLRAKAAVKFEQALEADAIFQDADPKSPDLTHELVVQAGDTLPLLCYRIYGESSYYMEVALFNKISNFRDLVPGTVIRLPSIK
jgi:hypothetical protein